MEKNLTERFTKIDYLAPFECRSSKIVTFSQRI